MNSISVTRVESLSIFLEAPNSCCNTMFGAIWSSWLLLSLAARTAGLPVVLVWQTHVWQCHVRGHAEKMDHGSYVVLQNIKNISLRCRLFLV